MHSLTTLHCEFHGMYKHPKRKAQTLRQQVEMEQACNLTKYRAHRGSMRIGKKPAHPPVAVAQQVHQLKQLLPLGSGLRSQRQQSLEELNSQELWELLPLGSGLRPQRQQSLEEAIFRRAPCAQQELF